MSLRATDFGFRPRKAFRLVAATSLVVALSGFGIAVGVSAPDLRHIRATVDFDGSEQEIELWYSERQQSGHRTERSATAWADYLCDSNVLTERYGSLEQPQYQHQVIRREADGCLDDILDPILGAAQGLSKGQLRVADVDEVQGRRVLILESIAEGQVGRWTIDSEKGLLIHASLPAESGQIVMTIEYHVDESAASDSSAPIVTFDPVTSELYAEINVDVAAAEFAKHGVTTPASINKAIPALAMEYRANVGDLSTAAYTIFYRDDAGAEVQLSLEPHLLPDAETGTGDGGASLKFNLADRSVVVFAERQDLLKAARELLGR